MGEYQEDADFNDLLGSDSDENEDGKVQKQTVDNLLSLDDVVISEGIGEHQSKNRDFMFLPESLDDDDDKYDDDDYWQSANSYLYGLGKTLIFGIVPRPRR